MRDIKKPRRIYFVLTDDGTFAWFTNLKDAKMRHGYWKRFGSWCALYRSQKVKP